MEGRMEIVREEESKHEQEREGNTEYEKEGKKCEAKKETKLV